LLRPRSIFLLEQLLGRSCDQLRALSRALLEKKKTLAEDEAVEQERLRVRRFRRKPGGAVEFCDVLQPRGIDACNRTRRRLVGPRPLPGSSPGSTTPAASRRSR